MDENKFRVEASRADRAGASADMKISWPLGANIQDVRALVHGAYLDALQKLQIHETRATDAGQ